MLFFNWSIQKRAARWCCKASTSQNPVWIQQRHSFQSGARCTRHALPACTHRVAVGMNGRACSGCSLTINKQTKRYRTWRQVTMRKRHNIFTNLTKHLSGTFRFTELHLLSPQDKSRGRSLKQAHWPALLAKREKNVVLSPKKKVEGPSARMLIGPHCSQRGRRMLVRAKKEVLKGTFCPRHQRLWTPEGVASYFFHKVKTSIALSKGPNSVDTVEAQLGAHLAL